MDKWRGGGNLRNQSRVGAGPSVGCSWGRWKQSRDRIREGNVGDWLQGRAVQADRVRPVRRSLGGCAGEGPEGRHGPAILPADGTRAALGAWTWLRSKNVTPAGQACPHPCQHLAWAG